MHSLEREAHDVLVGGYNCPCCGPRPKERPQYRRRVRHRISQSVTRAIAADPDFTDLPADLADSDEAARLPLVLICGFEPERVETARKLLADEGKLEPIAVSIEAALDLAATARFDLFVTIDAEGEDDSWLGEELALIQPHTPCFSVTTRMAPDGSRAFPFAQGGGSLCDLALARIRPGTSDEL